MKSVTGLGHIAIRVSDIDRTLDFYVGKLGFQEMMRIDRDGRLWLLYLRVTDDQFIELFPEAEGDRAPGKEANGLNHFCLTVSDIELTVAELEAKGVPLSNPKKLGVDGNMQCWVDDPDGNRIEFMQMAPDCMQAHAIARLKREPATA